jgi:hypothetical protein
VCIRIGIWNRERVQRRVHVAGIERKERDAVRRTPIHVADTILTGVHQPGERHFELLEAFASDPVLAKISEAFSKHSYRSHEFGDSLLIERGRGMPRR